MKMEIYVFVGNTIEKQTSQSQQFIIKLILKVSSESSVRIPLAIMKMFKTMYIVYSLTILALYQ